MSVFDLTFLAVVLATLTMLVAALISLAAGRTDVARRRLGRLALGLACYLGTVTLVSALLPRRVVALGADQCSDDWCIAVQGASPAPARDGRALAVEFRISSRARRISQRERFVVAYLLDGAGRRYGAHPAISEPPFDALLRPGEVLRTTRLFTVPAAATGLGVVIAREGDFAFPRCCIIGEGVLRNPPIVPLIPAGA